MAYTYLMETVDRPFIDKIQSPIYKFGREIIELIADKWTLLVIAVLSEYRMLRFTRLQEHLGGISQKMLTKTLRQLERHGLVTRHVHPVIPPHVDYEITELGESLGQALHGLFAWKHANIEAVTAAREAYDAHRLPASTPGT